MLHVQVVRTNPLRCLLVHQIQFDLASGCMLPFQQVIQSDLVNLLSGNDLARVLILLCSLQLLDGGGLVLANDFHSNSLTCDSLPVLRDSFCFAQAVPHQL